MKTIFWGISLGLLSLLTTSNSFAAFACQQDGTGNIHCVNDCNPPVINNAKVNLTTNQVTRNTIQAVTYNFRTSDTQGADGLSTISDREIVNYPLFRDFPLTLPQNLCAYNPNATYSLLIFNCQTRAYSGAIPPRINCSDYITPTLKLGY